MSGTAQIDYNALAAANGATNAQPAATQPAAPAPVDYNAIAAANGSTNPQPSTTPPVASPAVVAGMGGAAGTDPGTAAAMGANPDTIGGVIDSAKDIWGAAKRFVQNIPGVTQNPVDTVKGIWHALPPVELADQTKKMLPVVNTYEKARASGASIPDAIKAADITARAQDSTAQTVQAAADAYKKNPTRETVRALGDATALAASFFVPGVAEDVVGAGAGEVGAGVEGTEAADATTAAAPEAADTTAATATPEPAEQPSLIQKGKNLYQQITKPETIPQAPAQATLRSGAQTMADEAGVGDQVKLTPDQSIRTLGNDSIAAKAKLERGLYDSVNTAAETDMKDLYDKQYDLEEALDDPTNIASKSSMQKELDGINAQIKTGEDLARSKGVDASKTLDQAVAATRQRKAMEVVQKQLFNNESVVKGNVDFGEPEKINVDAAIRNAENLSKPSKYAPQGRLQQAFGEDGAKALKQGLYDARKAGTTALDRQALAIRVGKITRNVAIGAGSIAAGGGFLHELGVF